MLLREWTLRWQLLQGLQVVSVEQVLLNLLLAQEGTKVVAIDLQLDKLKKK